MPARLNLVGQRFGRWSVLEKTNERHRLQVVYICKCECGNTGKVVAPDLTRGDSKSCGCLFKDNLIKRNTKHGKARRGSIHKVYTVWLSMKQRCYDEKATNFHYYGGRGITVCDQWVSCFETFYDYVTKLPSYKESGKLEIDRIENDKGYIPGNVRWINRQGQMNNTSRNNVLTINGKRYSFANAVRKFGKAPYGTIKKRLYAGWSKRNAFLTPVGGKPCQ